MACLEFGSRARGGGIVTDCAVILCGAADVPRGTDVTHGDIRYIISHSDAQVVFVENAPTLEKVRRNLQHLPDVKQLVVMDPDVNVRENEALRMRDLLIYSAFSPKHP